MNTDPSSPENDANLSGLGRALLETGGSKPASGPWVPPTAEELGKLLPDYEIVKMLGRGGMGAVYMGKQKSLDRPVAIKILSTALEDADPSFAERFKNEARAMGKLNHPGIVAVHDFGEAEGGLLYIVMEFVEGTDVAKMIAKEGRLHTEHAMAITAHVCDALAYAHERGIIHRDIKPANIMVGYDGVVKVADFGLAKMTHSQNSGLTQSGMAMGTLHYMAPEALMLGSAVDHRADIYAVGVMLYQMLTGKIPQGMFELPSLQVKGLDPRYDGIIAKALREDREQRYQTVRDMRGDLDAILTQPVVKVDDSASQVPAALSTEARPQRPGGVKQPYRPPPPASQPVSKSSSGWWVGAVFGALALGGASFWLTKLPPQTSSSSQPATSVPPNPFEAIDPPGQPLPTPAGSSLAASPAPPMPPPSVPTTPVVDARQLAEVRLRVANYQKARHAKLSDIVTRYRAALAAAQKAAPADAAVYDRALSQAATLSAEVEKNLTAAEIAPLPPLAALADAEPARLAELRGILAKEMAGTESSLMADLDLSLATVQTSLSQAAKAAEAKAVENYRAELAAVLFRMIGAEPKKTASTTPVSDLTSATKDKPFVNSLGMKFVPVPGTKVLMCIHETRKGDYRAYHKASPQAGPWMQDHFFHEVPVSPTDDHPVIVLYDAAERFHAWLSEKEGLKYRLPTDREWSTAAGIAGKENPASPAMELSGRVAGVYPWGGDFPPRKAIANIADSHFKRAVATRRDIPGYTDGFAMASPVMSFPPNELGLHDLAGNLWEACVDDLNPSAPVFVLRGGCFLNSEEEYLNSSKRASAPVAPGTVTAPVPTLGRGFRSVLELPAKGLSAAAPSMPASPAAPAPSQPSAASFPSATKDRPFVNSLGMKFVPVKITGGPTDGKTLLFSVWETRVQDYAAFAAETSVADSSWRNVSEGGVAQTPLHPVVNVSWDDAVRFCEWLGKKDGIPCRLPSDHEWSCAGGLGLKENPALKPSVKSPQKQQTASFYFPWGNADQPPSGFANYKGTQTDAFPFTAPVGSFEPTAEGLYDLWGNVSEWCSDWHDPAVKSQRVVRGHSWFNFGPYRASNQRITLTRGGDAKTVGFRVVLELP